MASSSAASSPVNPSAVVAARRVAVCILMTTVDAFSVPRFLLVTSRRQPNRWIFPKGGIEDGEEPTEAAEREAWEEAGLIPRSAQHLCHLTTLPDSKPHPLSPSAISTSPDFVPSSVYSFELFHTAFNPEILADVWPESTERSRKWVDGWEELLSIVAWGKRENVMRIAVECARSKCA